MPIVRTFSCNECGYRLKVTLTAEQWNDPAPDCPQCLSYEPKAPMQQEFVPLNIGGSHRARAVKIAEDIAANDYGVADIHAEGRQGGTPKVRYKDQSSSTASTSWMRPNAEMLEGVTALGKQMRIQHGSGLDVIKTMPDMIANSKRISAKVW